MQRDVEIDVENTDKVGGFIGTLYINRENFAKLLLEEGLATVHAYSAEQSGNATELFAAEQKAKDGRKGMWHDYDPASTTADNSNPDESTKTAAPAETSSPTSTTATTMTTTTTTPAKQDYRDVLITHVEPTGSLKMQIISAATTEPLTALMTAFRTFHLSPAAKTTALTAPPKAGDVVAAQFSVDGEWYRARVRRNDREAQRADVVFVDYGNAETLPWNKLRALSPTAQFGLAKLKAQAVEAQLSFVQLPRSAEYLADAVAFLEDKTTARGEQLVARVDHHPGQQQQQHDRDRDRDQDMWVTLFEPDAEGGDDGSVNAELVGEGLAMVAGKGHGRPGWEREKTAVLKTFRAREEVARQERRGMWEYGDLTED